LLWQAQCLYDRASRRHAAEAQERTLNQHTLPEAQLDRFMFLIELDYPSEAEEI
jgi:MoxR-like ATPase